MSQAQIVQVPLKITKCYSKKLSSIVIPRNKLSQKTLYNSKNFKTAKLLKSFKQLVSMLGWGEVAIIIIGAIILLGPEKLTDFARELGKLYGEYKKAMRMIELEYIYGVKPISDEELEENLREKHQQLIDEIKKLD